MAYKVGGEVGQQNPQNNKKPVGLYEKKSTTQNIVNHEDDPKKIFGEVCLYKEILDKKKIADKKVNNTAEKISPEVSLSTPEEEVSEETLAIRAKIRDLFKEKNLKQQETEEIEQKKSKNKHCTLTSFAISGLEVIEITIEASISPGISRFDIIGLGDTAIKEARERVSKSITQCGFMIPSGNITINLAPAKIRKKGSLYDLPIALALLRASGQISIETELKDFVVAGELLLDGTICSIEGVYPCLLSALITKSTKKFIIPRENLSELYPLREKLTNPITAVENLNQCIHYLSQKNFVNNIENCQKEIEKVFIEQREKIAKLKIEDNLALANDQGQITKKSENIGDFNEVVGQEMAKLALQLSVIERLNVLFIGPPGNGKSMLMRRLPSILPKLSKNDALELSRIEYACNIKNYSLQRNVPFREVHSGIPISSLVGGGVYPKPGEISLAHKGFLFMDEISLFQQTTLQGLRTPIEQKKITLNRLSSSITYPADFTLVACCNPCACGFYGDPNKVCSCSKSEVNRFFSRLSQPLIDRFDIILYMGRVERKDFDHQANESSATIRKKIEQAIKNREKMPAFYKDRKMTEILDEHPLIKQVVLQAIEKEIISLRRVHSILKVLYAMMIYENREYDRLMLLQAIDLASSKNKLKK